MPVNCAVWNPSRLQSTALNLNLILKYILQQFEVGLTAPDGLQIGGSGVLVQPMTYIFDEEPVRWRRLLDMLEAAPQ